MIKNPVFWIVAIISLVLDQISKYWISHNFNLCETLPFLKNVFHFSYVINTGAAFSFFSHKTGCEFPTEEVGGVVWLRWLSLAVSLGLMAYGWFSCRLKLTEELGLGFILAGALGNGIDRFFFGYVIDFLDFRLINFPVFNLADVFINLGIIFLLIASFTPNNSRAKKSSH